MHLVIASLLRRRLVPLGLLAPAAATLAFAANGVARQTIDVVEAKRLLPRWDHATHIVQGWVDYDLLVTGRIPELLWDLWLQGYWPPVPSIFMIPFYVLLGGRMDGALWSSLAALVLVGVIGATVQWSLWRGAATLSASLFLALLMSSPFILAYSSLAMTEVTGALAQMVVVLAYARYRQRPDSSTARLFAISLTLLFFTKYNYFLLLAGPLVLYEWLVRTPGAAIGERAGMLWRLARRILTTPTGALITLYLVIVLVVMRTGGFQFQLLGQRVSVRSIGNSGYVALVLIFARVWYAHRRRQIDWPRLLSTDLRVRPLLVWFVVPVTIWLMSPYPNHIRDFVNLVVNLPVGEPTVEQSVLSYFRALRDVYFYDKWVVVLVIALVVIAGIRYPRQPPVIQWLLIALPIQLAVIGLHQTRFPRYLLLTVVLLCFTASSEVGRWFAGMRRARVAAALAAPFVLFAGVAASQRVVHEPRFRAAAFEHYVDSPETLQALDVLRKEIGPNDRLAIGGQTNELSHAVLAWELGPPGGVRCFPFELSGARRIELPLATKVLLVVPDPANPDSQDEPDYYVRQREAVQDRVGRGELVLRHDIAVPDVGASLRFYARPSPPEHLVPCRW
jgi:hypothetical protein